MVRDGLKSAGIQSQSKVNMLREFLKSHPDHIDAKIRLLFQLRKIAEIKTIHALQLDMKTRNEAYLQMDAIDIIQQGSGSSLSTIAIGGAKIDTSGFADKKLEAEEDREIWGEYAQALDSLFRNDDWRRFQISGLGELNGYMSMTQTPLEVCSPLMTALYNRLLPKLEQAIPERPQNINLWSTYGWMCNMATEKRPVQTVLDSCMPSPARISSWPPQAARDLMEAEARENNDWAPLAELLWQRRQGILYSDMSSQYTSPRTQQQFQALGVAVLTPLIPTTPTTIPTSVELLLEALIRASRIPDAESIIESLARFPRYADLTKHAAELALKCGRPDLEGKWSRLQIPAKTEIDGENLEAILFLQGRRPSVILINNENDGAQVASLIKTGALSEWDLSCHALDGTMSELMLKRENWFGADPRWAVLNADKKVISSGMGVPSESDIVEALERWGIEKPVDILRKFVRENPNHFDAKEDLIAILKKSAVDATKVKIGEIQALKPSTELGSDDDTEIWGEYASLFRQLVQYYANNPLPSTYWPPMKGDFANGEMSDYSPAMKRASKDLLPSVMSALQKLPSDRDLWELWVLLSDPVSSTQFNALEDEIAYSPLSSDSLPTALLGELALKYQRHENWRGIINIFEPFWEGNLSSGQISFNNVINPWQMNATTMPLIEAYLNLKQRSKLKEWIGLWKQSPRWRGVEPDVIKLFEKYGEDYSIL
jgi:hypothetical protein